MTKILLCAALLVGCGASDLSGRFSTFEAREVFLLPAGDYPADVVAPERHTIRIEPGPTVHFETWRGLVVDLDPIGEGAYLGTTTELSAGVACEYLRTTLVTLTDDWPRRLLVVDAFVPVVEGCGGPEEAGVAFLIGR